MFTNGLADFVTAVRGVLPDVGFIFVAPADTNGVTATQPLSAYVAAMRAFALSGGHEFFSMYDEWASWAVENARSQWSDNLHVSATGAYRLAARVKSLFLDF